MNGSITLQFHAYILLVLLVAFFFIYMHLSFLHWLFKTASFIYYFIFSYKRKERLSDYLYLAFIDLLSKLNGCVWCPYQLFFSVRYGFSNTQFSIVCPISHSLYIRLLRFIKILNIHSKECFPSEHKLSVRRLWDIHNVQKTFLSRPVF